MSLKNRIARAQLLLKLYRDQDKALKQVVQLVDLSGRAVLESHRQALDIAVAWRIALECPEVDLREDIDGLIRRLHDEIAKLEEQVV